MQEKINYVSAHAEARNSGGSYHRTFDQRAAHIKSAIKTQGFKSVQKDGGKYTGVSFDLAKDLPEIVQKVHAMRQGDENTAAADITLGQYMQKKYGIATDERGYMDGFLKLMGISKNNATLAQLAGRSASMKFTTIPELNKNFEWLVGETVTEALRAGLLQRGIYRRLVSAMETVPYDSIKIPVIKNANGFFDEYREGETIRMGTLEFDEIAVECKDIAAGFKLTERVARNVRLNLLQEFLISTTGKNLDRQLTFQAVNRLINGNTNGGADAAPVIGVLAPGAIDYDNDILEVVIGMAELGYMASTVLGDRQMIKEIMALPEFKGFDGGTVKADTMMPDVPFPSEYVFIPTGAMPAKAPAGGQLLFVDSRYAMKHFTTKPLTLEGQRVIRQLTDEFVVSMTTLFVKEYADAAMILDSTLDVTAQGFPADYDAEVLDQRGF